MNLISGQSLPTFIYYEPNSIQQASCITLAAELWLLVAMQQVQARVSKQ